jgi:Na+-transporting methylmalonyl-CoA/oxaloacetate decarboxylase gamma subunit
MTTTATTVLIIILSAGFIILLSLSIALIIVMMGILRTIRRIADRADKTTESFADVMSMVSKKVAPVALSAAIAAAMRRFKTNSKEK